MNLPDARQPQDVGADEILESLSTQQHVEPHRTLARALSQAQEQTGFGPGAAERAAEWLQLDARGAIGRLRRSELIQLARSIHRFWSRAASCESSAESQAV